MVNSLKESMNFFLGLLSVLPRSVYHLIGFSLLLFLLIGLINILRGS